MNLPQIIQAYWRQYDERGFERTITFDACDREAISQELAKHIIKNLMPPQVHSLEAYQLRVIEEKKALDEKLNSLLKFIDHGGIFPSLPDDEKSSLKKQAAAMQCYSACLTERIARWPGYEGTNQLYPVPSFFEHCIGVMREAEEALSDKKFGWMQELALEHLRAAVKKYDNKTA